MVCSIPSGSLFGIGTTIIDCTATDSAGNVTQSSFSITVTVETVQINVKPGDATNSINLRSQGSVPVAIFGSARFDVTTVNPATVRVAGAPIELRKRHAPILLRSIDGDGFLDLLVHVRTEDLRLRDGEVVAVIEGNTFAGDFFTGRDSVRTVPNRSSSPRDLP